MHSMLFEARPNFFGAWPVGSRNLGSTVLQRDVRPNCKAADVHVVPQFARLLPRLLLQVEYERGCTCCMQQPLQTLQRLQNRTAESDVPGALPPPAHSSGHGQSQPRPGRPCCARTSSTRHSWRRWKWARLAADSLLIGKLFDRIPWISCNKPRRISRAFCRNHTWVLVGFC